MNAIFENSSKPTPPIWGNIAAALIALSVVMQGYEMKIDNPLFNFVSFILAGISAILIVFTGVKK